MAENSTKAGWKVAEWARDAGCSRSKTWELIKAGKITSVKLDSSRIITTPPAQFLASLGSP